MAPPPAIQFLCATMFMIGCMLYLAIIPLIFYRLTFIRLTSRDFSPPYWINMGGGRDHHAGRIDAGAADRRTGRCSTCCAPFLPGFTLFFWAAATWWIPFLIALMLWRYLIRRDPPTYEPQVWGMVFPLAMYTTATFQLSRALDLGFLRHISEVFIFIALAAWAAAFVGLARQVSSSILARPPRRGQRPEPSVELRKYSHRRSGVQAVANHAKELPHAPLATDHARHRRCRLPAAGARLRAIATDCDGPVVAAARAALELGNPNPVLIWVQPKDDAEVRRAFAEAVAVRKLGPQAREMADRNFFETLVRVHRAGEGAAYTGLKPAGRDLGPAIPLADKAVASGSDAELTRFLASSKPSTAFMTGSPTCSASANSSRRSSPPGRDYIASYVGFVHFVERLHEGDRGRRPRAIIRKLKPRVRSTKTSAGADRFTARDLL